jgi:hypothetical protein
MHIFCMAGLVFMLLVNQGLGRAVRVSALASRSPLYSVRPLVLKIPWRTHDQSIIAEYATEMS